MSPFVLFKNRMTVEWLPGELDTVQVPHSSNGATPEYLPFYSRVKRTILQILIWHGRPKGHLSPQGNGGTRLFQKRFLICFGRLFEKRLFTEELERPLLRLIPLLVKSLNTAKTNRMLLAADNATLLCLH